MNNHSGAIRFLAFTALLTCLPCMESSALSKEERARLVVLGKEAVGPARTLVSFGEKVFLGERVVGRCSVTNRYAALSNYEDAGGISAENVARISGEYNQENALAALETLAQEVEDLEDMLSAMCLRYWSGDLETSEYLRLNVVLNRALVRQKKGRETILLIDSPGRVYRSVDLNPTREQKLVRGNVSRVEILPSGVTNADYLALHLASEGVRDRVITTTASPMWTRTDDIAEVPPKLIVLHLSAFEDEKRVYSQCDPHSKALNNHCGYELFNFLAALMNAGSSFVLYSRTPKICRSETRLEIRHRLQTHFEVSSERFEKVVLFQANYGDTFMENDPSLLGSRMAVVISRFVEQGPVNAANSDQAACGLAQEDDPAVSL